MGDAAARAAALKEQGNAAVAARKLPRAKQLYSDALRLDESNHTIWSNRSGVNLDLGDAVAAEADAQQCIERAPEWPKGYYRLGLALEAQERHEAAAAAFADGLARDAANADLKACHARAAAAAVAAAAVAAAAEDGAGSRDEPAAGAAATLPRRDGRPTLAEALTAARAMVEPASLPRVPRLGSLVAERHGATLRLATDAQRGRFLTAARAVRPYEVLAVEPALLWAPPRTNEWGMCAPAFHEPGPELKAATAAPGTLAAWLLQMEPFHSAAAAHAAASGGGSGGRPELELPPVSKGELLLRVIQRNSHAAAWSEGHPGEGGGSGARRGGCVAVSCCHASGVGARPCCSRGECTRAECSWPTPASGAISRCPPPPPPPPRARARR